MLKLKTEEDILDLIKKDKWMMQILWIVKKLDLPDWWIGAGFVRNKVWDYLHGYKKRTPLNDIDIIFFDKKNKSLLYEDRLQNKLNKKYSKINWSITNQVRMHKFNGDKCYNSSADGLARWTEIPTCIGVKLDQNNLVLLASHGIKDLVNLKVRIGPLLKNKKYLYKKRMKEKNWKKTWPKLKIL